MLELNTQLESGPEAERSALHIPDSALFQPLQKENQQPPGLLTLSSCPCMKATFAIWKRQTALELRSGSGLPPLSAPARYQAVGVDDGPPVVGLVRQAQRLVQQPLGFTQFALHDAELRAERVRCGYGAVRCGGTLLPGPPLRGSGPTRRQKADTARPPFPPRSAPHLGFLQQEDNGILAVLLLVVPGREGEGCGAEVTAARPGPPAARRASPPRKPSAAPPGRAHRRPADFVSVLVPVPPRSCRAPPCQAGRGRASPAGQRLPKRHRARGSAAAIIFPGRGPFKSSPSSRDEGRRVTVAERSRCYGNAASGRPGPQTRPPRMAPARRPWRCSRCRDLAAAGAPLRGSPCSRGQPALRAAASAGKGLAPRRAAPGLGLFLLVPPPLTPACIYARGV